VRESLRRLISKDYVDTRLAALDCTNPYIRVELEEFSSSPVSVVRRIVESLGCDPDDLPTNPVRTKKQASSRLEDCIANFAEVSEALEKAGLRWGAPHL